MKLEEDLVPKMEEAAALVAASSSTTPLRTDTMHSQIRATIGGESMILQAALQAKYLKSTISKDMMVKMVS